MKFETGQEFIDSFIDIPKDIAIKYISHNGGYTKYLTDTFVRGIEPVYRNSILESMYIFLLQDGDTKKFKYYPNQKFEIKFSNEGCEKSIEDKED